MFRLLKDGLCFDPENRGKKDILLYGGTLCKIDNIIPGDFPFEVEIYDCSDRIVCPAFIDQHVHITGGGGEEGPASRIPEINISDIIQAGVSTVVGVLGVDDITRSISELLAKARSLQTEGINTYIYTGSYGIPPATLTGGIKTDIAWIDKVIGTGEIAISDYRSSNPDTRLLSKIAYEAKVGGMIGGKAGVVHIHVGDGKDGLKPLFNLLEASDFPIDMFVPTHVNRNRKLFSEAITHAQRGGFIDLTAGETSDNGIGVAEALGVLFEMGVDMEKVTISSDANGSAPMDTGDGSGVGKMKTLFDDIRFSILSGSISAETALKAVTSNVAKILKLYPQKGALKTGSDADVLVLKPDDLSIDKLFIGGEVFIDGGVVKKKGRYEM